MKNSTQIRSLGKEPSMEEPRALPEAEFNELRVNKLDGPSMEEPRALTAAEFNELRVNKFYGPSMEAPAGTLTEAEFNELRVNELYGPPMEAPRGLTEAEFNELTLNTFGSLSMEEPRTLTEAEFNEFRAKALEIINTHTREEATKIFLAGSEEAAAAAKEFAGAATEAKEKPKKTICGKRSRSYK